MLRTSPLTCQEVGGQSVPADEEVDGLPHLAERLNLLFAHVPRTGGSELYSNDRAASDLAAAGISVTAGYLRQLRSGTPRHPPARLLAGIAQLFEVPITYFFDDDQADKITAQLQALTRLRAAGVRGIVARSGDLTSDDLNALGPLLEQIRQLDQDADQEGPPG